MAKDVGGIAAIVLAKLVGELEVVDTRALVLLVYYVGAVLIDRVL